MSLMIAMCLTLSCKHLVVTEPLHRGPPCKVVYPQAVLEPCDPILESRSQAKCGGQVPPYSPYRVEQGPLRP